VDGRGITTLVCRSISAEQNEAASAEIRALIFSFNGEILPEAV
jgi:hypothetical protein